MSLVDALYDRLPEPIGSYLKRRRHNRLNAPKPQTLGEHIIATVKTVVWAVTVVTIVNGLALASFVVPTGSMESTVMAGDFLFVNKFKYGPSTPQIIPFINQPLPYFKLPALWKPAQGDVIVFVFPGNRDEVKPQNFEYYLKRCVAVAGDMLFIKAGKIYVNGVEYPLPKHGQFYSWDAEVRKQVYESDRASTFPAGRGYTRDDYGPIRIPKQGDIIDLTEQNFAEWAVFIGREGHEVDQYKRTIDGVSASTYTVERNYVFGMGDNRDNSLDSRFWGFIPEDDVVGTPMVVYWSWEPDDAQSGKRLSFSQRLKSIRWGRLGTIIN